MKTTIWTLEVGLSVPDITGEVDVEDDATEDEIEAAVRDDAFQYITLSWKAADD